MNNFNKSVESQNFETGAKRDSQNDKPRPDLISPFMEERVGDWLKLGVIHYGEHNWSRGIPMSRCLASLNRHLMKFKQGAKDEDHLSAIVFNAMCLIHYEEMIKRGWLPKELDDLVKYEQLTNKDKEAAVDTVMTEIDKL